MIGFCNHALGQFSDAEQSYKQSIATLERAGGDSEEIAEVLDQYARLCSDTGRIEEAERHKERKNSLLNNEEKTEKAEAETKEKKENNKKESKSRYASAIDEEHEQTKKSKDQDDSDVSKSLLDMSLNDSLDEALDESMQKLPNNIETTFNSDDAGDQTSTSLDKVTAGSIRLTNSVSDGQKKEKDKKKDKSPEDKSKRAAKNRARQK